MASNFPNRLSTPPPLGGVLGTPGLTGGPPPVGIRSMIGQPEMDQEQNAFFKLLDFLQRGEYFTANIVRTVLGEEDLDPMGALAGRRKSTFVDVAEDLGLEGNLAKIVGLVGGIFMDPLTYVGLGGLGRAGKAAKMAKLNKVGKTADLNKVRGLIEDELRAAKNSGIDIFGYGRTLRERAERGEQSLFTVFGRTPEEIIRPLGFDLPGLRKFDAAVLGTTGDVFSGLGKTGPGKWAKGVFSTRTGIEDFDEGHKLFINNDRLLQQAGFETSEFLAKSMNRLMPDEITEVAKMIQRGAMTTGKAVLTLSGRRQKLVDYFIGKGFTPADAERFAVDSKDALARLFEVQKKAGFPINRIGKDGTGLDYFPFVNTAKGSKWFRDNIPGFRKSPEDIRKLNHNDINVLDRQFVGLDNVEVNQAAKQGRMYLDADAKIQILDKTITPELVKDIVKQGGKKLPTVDFDIMDTNIASAFATRFVRAGRAMNTRDYLSRIAQQFGKRVSDPDAAGFVKSGHPFFKSVPGGKISEDVVFPPEMAKVMDDTFSKLFDVDEMNKAADVARSMTSLWRTATISVFPATWGRDLLSNIWTYMISGTWKNPLTLAKGMQISLAKRHFGKFSDDLLNASIIKRGAFGGKLPDVIDKKTGRVRYSGDEVYDLARRHGIIGGEVAVEEERARTKLIRNRVTRKLTRVGRKLNPFSQSFVGWKGGFFVRGRVIDDPFRLGKFIDGLEQGMSEVGAATEVKKWFFDWFDLTKTERLVLREVFPFYTWTRKNLPLQLEILSRRPGVFSAVGKVKAAVERDQMRDDPAFLPHWIRDGSPIRMGINPETGDTDYLLLQNFLPAADIGEIFDPLKMAFGMLTPFLKEPIALSTNFDSHFKQKVTRFEGEKHEVLGLPVDSRISHALRNVRLLNEFDKVKSGRKKVSKLFDPLRRFPVNIEKQRFFKEIELKRDLRSLETEERRNIRMFQQGIRKKASLANIEELQKQKAKLEAEINRLFGG